ncbi:MAG: Alanine dehydrogenase [Methanomethylovorans sp. PtaU1.Bin093]|uniref:alanine dehydrogenase n=1 Tax=Methanomethylovorans sp. PtaU1.Bin093 TaxID=1811679 RepID=UPI0009CBC635|nr:alanine dehydrogenase [Methanomethylovorans sp. PtaU1.Bin093]OPY19766.1 MAG: Alanine dehydrogenase [Methanomethylovorans sp. PtaU1.Bin093]
MDVLWLDQSDVQSLLDMPSTIEAVEKGFEQHGLKKVQMPAKSYLIFEKHNGDLRTMPAYMEEEDIAGVKIVNVHPDNRQRGLPTVMGVVVLNSTQTGEPLVIMDGTLLTDMRTGAAGGVAAKHLARKDSHVVGMVGVGDQARTQLLALSKVMDIQEVKLFCRNVAHCDHFEKDMSHVMNCEFLKKEKIQDVCDCDILVTTTPVREPLVMSEWVQEGTHINAIGADAKGKEELDPGLLLRARIVVDDLVQASHSGEVNVPLSKGMITAKDICCELGEIVAGIRPGRQSDDEITVFDSTGLAVQDMVTANMVYRKALEQGIGQNIRMF